MLIYHLGTRDGLLREVLGAARERQVTYFTELIRLRPDEPYPHTLAQAWTAISGPHGQRYLRIFSRLHDTAGQPHWPGFRRTAPTDWLAPLEHGLASLGCPDLATVVLAVLRGLLMDLDATGDTPPHRTGLPRLPRDPRLPLTPPFRMRIPCDTGGDRQRTARQLLR